jgi:hypothetical protein
MRQDHERVLPVRRPGTAGRSVTPAQRLRRWRCTGCATCRRGRRRRGKY